MNERRLVSPPKTCAMRYNDETRVGTLMIQYATRKITRKIKIFESLLRSYNYPSSDFFSFSNSIDTIPLPCGTSSSRALSIADDTFLRNGMNGSTFR